MSVVQFPGSTLNDIDTLKVLEAVKEANPDNVFVMTLSDNDTAEFYSSTGDVKTLYFHLSQFLGHLVSG